MVMNIVSKMKNIYHEHSSVAGESAVTNIRRILYASVFGMFLDIFAIVIFLTVVSGDETWRTMLVHAHTVMSVILLAVLVTAVLLKRKKISQKFAHPLQYVGFFAVLALGVATTAIDQRITSNITPYICACLIAATVIIMRPVFSFLMFACAFSSFVFLLSISSLSSAMLWSNIINGLTVTAISCLISIIMWRNNYITIKQKRRIKIQQNQLGKVNKKLRKMAYVDSLTGLSNRRHFDRIIKKEKALMLRKGHQSCLIMLDLDHFKDINDQFGHPSGDSLLKQVGKFLLRHIRKYDTLCRLGGDEFIILLPQTALNDAETVAENLRALIEKHNFSINKLTINITASFGVARLICTDNSALANQYLTADHALYRAKQDGRNLVETWRSQGSHVSPASLL